MCCCLLCTTHCGAWAMTQACALDWESNQWPFGSRPVLNPLSYAYASQGITPCFQVKCHKDSLTTMLRLSYLTSRDQRKILQLFFKLRVILFLLHLLFLAWQKSHNHWAYGSCSGWLKIFTFVLLELNTNKKIEKGISAHLISVLTELQCFWSKIIQILGLEPYFCFDFSLNGLIYFIFYCIFSITIYPPIPSSTSTHPFPPRPYLF